MSKVCYSTKNGSLSILNNRCIELVFYDQKIVFDLYEYVRFVEYFNSYTKFQKADKSNIYAKLLESLSKNEIKELQKLINVPIIAPKSNIFEHLYFIKRQEMIFGTPDNKIEVNFDFIGLN